MSEINFEEIMKMLYLNIKEAGLMDSTLIEHYVVDFNSIDKSKIGVKQQFNKLETKVTVKDALNLLEEELSYDEEIVRYSGMDFLISNFVHRKDNPKERELTEHYVKQHMLQDAVKDIPTEDTYTIKFTKEPLEEIDIVECCFRCRFDRSELVKSNPYKLKLIIKIKHYRAKDIS